jgi:hypothetical protein
MGAMPEMTAKPNLGTMPEMTAKPNMGTMPEMTAKPNMGMMPEITAKPNMGAMPQMTAKPNMGAMPEMTAKPNMGMMPEMTAKPNMGAMPNMAAKPNMGAMPEMTAKPNMGAMPEKMNMPNAFSNAEADMSKCGYKSGELPPCGPLAVGFVPWQEKNPPKYGNMEALTRGTLFPGLDHRALCGLLRDLDDLATLAAQLTASPVFVLVAPDLALQRIVNFIHRRVEIACPLLRAQQDAMLTHQRHLSAMHDAFVPALFFGNFHSQFADLIEIAPELTQLLLDVGALALRDFSATALDDQLHELFLPPAHMPGAGCSTARRLCHTRYTKPPTAWRGRGLSPA